MNFDDLPPEVLSEITRRAMAEGMLPKPDGYTPDGNPVWDLERMAEWFGHTPEDAKELLRDYLREHPTAEAVDPAQVHRTH